MIDTSSEETNFALRTLWGETRSSTRPLVLWIGAGASRWCEYPSWPEFATHCHSDFNLNVKNYDRSIAANYLATSNYPAVFQCCADADPSRYRKLLVKGFGPRSDSGVYKRFLNALAKINPLFILTTNVDESLEKNFAGLVTVQASDIERTTDLLHARTPFVCKLHGTASSVDSMVFSTSDYEKLKGNHQYISNLQNVISNSSILFVGYGLADQYVLDMLSRVADMKTVFGDGPHFVIAPEKPTSLPKSVRVIGYKPTPHTDHRASIQVLEEYSSDPSPLTSILSTQGNEITPAVSVQSAYLLSDVLPAGTWKTSQELIVTPEEGGGSELIIVGDGFRDGELPNLTSTAAHDLMVGLICFEKVYLPTNAIGRLHKLLGSENFWELVRQGIVIPVEWHSLPAVRFQVCDSIGDGSLTTITSYGADKGAITTEQLIRIQIKPVPGRESQAQRLFEELGRRVVRIEDAEFSQVPNLARGLLVRPSIRSLLGVSEGMPVRSVARWNMFPILRLANVVQFGVVCRALNIASLRLNFGTARLAGPAFAAAYGNSWLDDVACYVVAGRLDGKFKDADIQNHDFVGKLLKFRESQPAENVRADVLKNLATSDAADVISAINGALQTQVGSKFLQNARDKYVELMCPTTSQINTPASIWNEDRWDEHFVTRWRAKSLELLKSICRDRSIKLKNLCPCGSGEKLQDCCLRTLVDSASI